MAAAWKQISYNFLFLPRRPAGHPEERNGGRARDRRRPPRCGDIWTVTFPLLSPTIFFLLVVNIVYAFFDTFGIIDNHHPRRPGESHGNPGL